jgi:thiamine-phosphate pyrophosphorylase
MNTGTRLYIITPERFDPAAFAPHLAAALDAGDGLVACVQLRLKGASDDEIRRACQTLLPITARADVAFLLNDRPDLARETGCDGVHIGQDDISYAEARRIMGKNASIGVSCHDSRHLAMEAAEAGADYVAFGPIFASPTKQARPPIGLELVEWWSSMMEIPSVAIGGITLENAGSIVQAGADFIAVLSAIWTHPQGAATGVLALRQILANAAAVR